MSGDGHVLIPNPPVGPSRNNRSWMNHAFRYSLKSGIAFLGATWVLIATVVRATTGELPVVSQTQDWIQVIKDVGFPITVASVCLWVIVVSLKEFTRSLYEFSKALSNVEKALETHSRAISRLEVLLLTGRDIGKERI